MWRISIFLRSFVVCALALGVSEPIAGLPGKRSGRQAKSDANLFPHVLRVAKRGQSLFLGRGISGVAKINGVVTESGEPSSERSECRVVRKK
jgi:hypothetical protein